MKNKLTGIFLRPPCITNPIFAMIIYKKKKGIQRDIFAYTLSALMIKTQRIR